MQNQIDSIKQNVLARVAAAEDPRALDEVRVEALGKKGAITGLMKQLGGLSPDERRETGAALNVLKDEVAGAIDARKAVLARAALDARLVAERIDVTLPSRPEAAGSVHPVSQVTDEVIAIFC